MSYLLHRANLSNWILPYEKYVNRDKFNTWIQWNWYKWLEFHIAQNNITCLIWCWFFEPSSPQKIRDWGWPWPEIITQCTKVGQHSKAMYLPERSSLISYNKYVKPFKSGIKWSFSMSFSSYSLSLRRPGVHPLKNLRCELISNWL